MPVYADQRGAGMARDVSRLSCSIMGRRLRIVYSKLTFLARSGFRHSVSCLRVCLAHCKKLMFVAHVCLFDARPNLLHKMRVASICSLNTHTPASSLLFLGTLLFTPLAPLESIVMQVQAFLKSPSAQSYAYSPCDGNAPVKREGGGVQSPCFEGRCILVSKQIG